MISSSSSSSSNSIVVVVVVVVVVEVVVVVVLILVVVIVVVVLYIIHVWTLLVTYPRSGQIKIPHPQRLGKYSVARILNFYVKLVLIVKPMMNWI